jgi:hypothetical protein
MATIVTRASKGSALTWTEGDDNITNLNTDKIELTDLSVSTDTANGAGSLSYNNTTGTFTFAPADLTSYLTSYTETDPVVGAVTGIVKADGAGNISAAVAGTDYLATETFTEVSQDTTPQLGGNLDVNGQSIVSASDGNIAITPNGTGSIVLDGVNWPQADGTANYVLKTNGSGQLSWTNTVDGTNKFGYLTIPAVGTKTSSYTLATADVGKYVQVGSGGSITIPNSTFAEGDVVVIVNNHTAAITITCTISDAYIAGTDTDKATVSLATRGVCNILFLSGTRCIITGNIS